MFERGKLAALVAVAMADNKVDEKEREFLASYCVRLGASIEELDAVMKDPRSALRQTPVTRDEKLELLKAMFQMSAADGDLKDAEKQTIAILAGHLGLTPDDIDLVLDN